MSPLTIEPRLASWMHADDPSQMQLDKFLRHAIDVLGPSLQELKSPLALRLDVAIPRDVPLLDQRDLDNYAFPLATRLAQKAADKPIDCVWATKRHGSISSIGIDAAVPMPDDESPPEWLLIQTTASIQTTAYKEQVQDGVRGAAELPEGPVSLQLSYTVGPGRNWANLWKPTIDAMGPLLGSDSARPWNPRDGRIVELGLHRSVDPALRHDVLVAIAATPLGLAETS
jgi:hypothetical protein